MEFTARGVSAVSHSSQESQTQSLKDFHLPNHPVLRRIFFGEQGIRAGWSVLLFIALYMLFSNLILRPLSHLVSFDLAGPIPFPVGLLQEAGQLLIVVAATWVMSRIEHRSLFSYGYSGDHKLGRFVGGVVCGLFCLSLLIAILWRSGLLVFDGRLLTGFSAIKYALAWGLVFLLVGLYEESLLRGYLQFTLARGVGFWWAALLLSIAFALGHLGNDGESLLGLIEVGIGGLVFCLSLWYTKSLFWAVGFHAGWDWGQSYLYGTADSGLLIKNHLLASHATGRVLWSGGTVGPEGSALIVPLVILLAGGMWGWWGKLRKNDHAVHTGGSPLLGPAA